MAPSVKVIFWSNRFLFLNNLRSSTLQTQGKPLGSGGGGDLASEVAALKKLLHDVGISSMTEMRRVQMRS